MPSGSSTPTQQLAAGAGQNLLAKLLGRGLHITSQLILARWLGPALFGLYAIGWNILRMAATILPMGTDTGVIRAAGGLWPGQKARLARLSGTAVVFTLAFGALTGALLFFSSDWLAALFGKPELGPVLRILALALPLSSGLKVAASATRVSQQMKYGNLAEELVQPLANLLLAVLLLWLGWSLRGALWASVFSFGLGLALALFYLVRLFSPIFAWSELSALLRVSLPIAAAASFATLSLLADRLLVGYFLSEDQAGIYQAVSLFALFFVTVLNAFKVMVAPVVAAAYEAGQTERVASTYHQSTRWGLYLTIPVAGLLIAAPATTLEIMFGSVYAAGATALVILTLAQIANMLSGPVEHFLLMTGHQRDWVWISGAMFVLNLALGLWLIPRWGLSGAAWAALLTFAGTSLAGGLRVRACLGIWPYQPTGWKLLAATVSMSLTLLATIHWLPLEGLAQWLMLASQAPIVFFGSLWLLGLEAGERELLQAWATRRAEKR